ncbi:MAG: glutaredoxin protein [Variovorax sp.]|nr:glutaredoxin protein [Variovorax sp.]
MKLAIPLCCAAGLLLAAGCALAQPVYRTVDANGKVVFSDRPAADGRALPGGILGGHASAAQDEGNAALPYELRQVVGRYPVTLYTGEDCAPCASGRSLLVARGVPFSERTVRTTEDVQALQDLSGQGSLPLLGIGAQQVKGFSEAQWSQYLDAAGYPKSTQLPSGYRNPPAAPLVALRSLPVTPAAPAPAPVPAAAQRVAPAAANPGNPAGIRF